MTRNRRYLICAAILAVCAGITLGVLAMLPPQPGVTKANFDRVKVGMALAEVETILGPHGGVEGPLWVGNNAFGGGTSRWFGPDNAQIEVELDIDNIATRKAFLESTETIPDKLHRWLHLPK